MKNFSLLPGLVLIIALLVLSIFQTGCDSTEPDADKDFAYLELYWNNLVHYSEILTEKDDGYTKEVILPDDSVVNLTKYAFELLFPPATEDEDLVLFGVLAAKTGFYSQFRVCNEKDTIRIHTDTGFTPVEAGKVCGVIYSKYYGYLQNMTFDVLAKNDSSLVTTITTDVFGCYAIDLAHGEYILSYDAEMVDYTVETLYHDIEVFYVDVVDKPNIYLYPENTITLDVTIDYPQGGKVTVSEPEYGRGWMNIKVTLDGKINDKYDYLFYECATGNFEIPKGGWVIAQSELEEFFKSNLQKTGFAGREIIDFIEFWIPKFNEFKYYEIYPLYQTQLDEKIVLKFSLKPDNIVRLTYIIKGRDNNDLKLETPIIPSFNRNGFFVTEWGVIQRD